MAECNPVVHTAPPPYRSFAESANLLSGRNFGRAVFIPVFTPFHTSFHTPWAVFRSRPFGTLAWLSGPSGALTCRASFHTSLHTSFHTPAFIPQLSYPMFYSGPSRPLKRHTAIYVYIYIYTYTHVDMLCMHRLLIERASCTAVPYGIVYDCSI